MIDDDDIIPLPERLERLRQWRDATRSDMAELILDRLIISHMLDLIDERPTYEPQTTERDRACLSLAVSQEREVTEEISTGVEAVLEDLKNAEAIINATK